MLAYYHIRDELGIKSEIIFKGHHCLIPASFRPTILERIHNINGHLGIVASLQRARMSVFWPGRTADVKNYIQTCDTCSRLFPNTQRKEPLLQHDRPDRPWAKLAADLFSIGKHIVLITTDYWSNCFEIDELRETTSQSVIRCLRRHFATHWILNMARKLNVHMQFRFGFENGLSLSLYLSLALELSVGLTMYQFLCYGGDLYWLFSLFFFWLA